MKKPWDRPESERIKMQKGRVRAMLIGAWAPREPMFMNLVLKWLEQEKRLPLKRIHAVIDRFASMNIITQVVTHEEACAFVRGLPESFAIALGPCACRIHTAEPLGPDARDLAAGKLDFCRQSPLELDIQIAKCAETFGALPTYRMISKEELLELEKTANNLGLVSNVYMMWGGEGGICHCSSATCAPFLANQALDGRSAVIKKGFSIARTDEAACDASGACAKVCHFNARKIVDGPDGPRLSVDLSKCYGCGICAQVCPRGAIRMVPRNKRAKGMLWILRKLARRNA
ncbi:MAG: 4Fe-4S dicluster domain-containing protein [Deltaproteobacteria bacterium]|nr:4Fe-4S dicluster domain-containing protein [Deltaproteobacteria bacterium]